MGLTASKCAKYSWKQHTKDLFSWIESWEAGGKNKSNGMIWNSLSLPVSLLSWHSQAFPYANALFFPLCSDFSYSYFTAAFV